MDFKKGDIVKISNFLVDAPKSYLKYINAEGVVNSPCAKSNGILVDILDKNIVITLDLYKSEIEMVKLVKRSYWEKVEW